MTKIGEKCLCHYSLCYKGLGMNTSPEQNRIATQLEIAAQVLRTNHPWEFREGGKWVLADPKVFPVLQLLMRDYEIRLTLATPPDKRPLHNPDNLTAEQVGAGYRLILLGEPFNPKAEYMERKDRWLATIQSSEYNLHFTYRLPLSTPWPEVEKPEPREVDLGPEDVPPNSALRLVTWDAGVHVMPSVWRSGVSFAIKEGVDYSTYTNLRRDGWLINRPRHRDADGNPTLWEPCSKKVEG